MFTAAVSLQPKSGRNSNQRNSPSTNKWINKNVVYAYNRVLFSHEKK